MPAIRLARKSTLGGDGKEEQFGGLGRVRIIREYGGIGTRGSRKKNGNYRGATVDLPAEFGGLRGRVGGHKGRVGRECGLQNNAQGSCMILLFSDLVGQMAN